MKTFTVIFSCLLFSMPQCSAQIWGDSPRKLPQDLRTQTILFLRFDSVEHPQTRPAGMDKRYFERWQYHNEHLQEHNETLKKYAAKYPFKYKIVSMSDTAYRAHGAKYLFWLNTFDTMSKDGIGTSLHGEYISSDHTPRTELGIIDLTSDKQYLISTGVSITRSYFYQDMFKKLFVQLKDQFDIEVK
jgi:hypothetical protein